MDDVLFQQLCDKKYIKPGVTLGEFIITPKGIWEYEIKTHISSIDDFLDYFEQIYFHFLNQNQEKKLNPKDRVILFTLLAIRSFSEDTKIDLNVNQEILKVWKDIFDKTQKKLCELNVISQDESDDFWKKKGKKSENVDDITDPVYDLMRHSGTNLVPLTQDIYKLSGSKKYYLKLSRDPNIFREEIIFLLKKIFSNIETDVNLREEISHYFNEISFNYSHRVFEEVNEYANPEFDDQLRQIILYM